MSERRVKGTPKRKQLDGGMWLELLEPLMTRKEIGQWHLIKVMVSEHAARQSAERISYTKQPGLPPGEWETHVMGCELYARYLGEGKA